MNIFIDDFLNSLRCGLTSQTLCETRLLLSTTRLDEQYILLGHQFNHHNDPIMISLQQDSGFSRVLIFTVLGVGHFNGNHIIAIHIMITNTLVRVPNLYFGTIQLGNLTTNT